MKKITFAAIIISFLFFIPSSAFALFDIGVYGGYSFAGDVETDVKNVEPVGPEYGAIAHYTDSILIFNLGIGGYYQRSPLKDGSIEYTKQTAGIDGYAQLDIPLIPIMPYLRASLGVWENIEGDVDNDEYFKSYSFGAGVDFPLPVVPLAIYTEYVFSVGFQDGNTAKSHAAHLGVRLAI